MPSSSLSVSVTPFSFRTADTLDDEYRFVECPHLPGSSASTAMVCTHHMAIFGTDSGHIHFYSITEGGGAGAVLENNDGSGDIGASTIPYPTIDASKLLKAVSIAPAGVPSSAVQAMAVSPCHSRLACITLDGTVHLLQLYYSVAVVDAATATAGDEENAAPSSSYNNSTNNNNSNSSESAKAHATSAGKGTPLLLDVRRIGTPIALASVTLTVPNPAPLDASTGEMTPRNNLLGATPRSRPATRKFTVAPSPNSATLLWTDSRTVIVGCTKHSAVVGIVLSRSPFLGNVWIADGITEPERVKKIVNTDSGMPVASKVILLTYDSSDSSPLLQLQHGVIGVASQAQQQQQALVITTELRSSLVAFSSPTDATIVDSALIDFSADALLERAYSFAPNNNNNNSNDPSTNNSYTNNSMHNNNTPPSVIMEIDPPLNNNSHNNNSSAPDALISKASNLWRGIKSDILNTTNTNPTATMAATPRGGSPAGTSAATMMGGGSGRVSLPLFDIVQIGQKPREEGYFGATTATPAPCLLQAATYTPQGLFDTSALPESEGPNGAMFLRLPLPLELAAAQSASSSRLVHEVGAAEITSSVKVYTARHNQRVFEADPTNSGKVLKTLRYEPREDTEANPFASMEEIPLGLLVGLPSRMVFAPAPAPASPSAKKAGGKKGKKKGPSAAAAAAEEPTTALAAAAAGDDGDDEDASGEQCYVWSEAPTFAAVVRLSGTAGCTCCWAMVTEEPPMDEEGNLIELTEADEPLSELCFDIRSSCSYRHNQFRFVLCSTNKVMIVPILPRPWGQKAAQHALMSSASSAAANFEVSYMMVAPQQQPSVVVAPTAPATVPSPRGRAPTVITEPSSPTTAGPAILVTEDAADGTAAEANDDEGGKKKKKKVVVVKKVVKKKGGLVVDTQTSRLVSPRQAGDDEEGAEDGGAASEPASYTSNRGLGGLFGGNTSASSKGADEETPSAAAAVLVVETEPPIVAEEVAEKQHTEEKAVAEEAPAPTAAAAAVEEESKKEGPAPPTDVTDVEASAPIAPAEDLAEAAVEEEQAPRHHYDEPTAAVAVEETVAPIHTAEEPAPTAAGAETAVVAEEHPVVEEVVAAAEPEQEQEGERVVPGVDEPTTTSVEAEEQQPSVVEPQPQPEEQPSTAAEVVEEEASVAVEEPIAAAAPIPPTVVEEETKSVVEPPVAPVEETVARKEEEVSTLIVAQPVGEAVSVVKEKEEPTTLPQQPAAADEAAVLVEQKEEVVDAVEVSAAPLPQWPCDSAATRLYDVTDKIFRSYAANSMDSAYHCPLLTNILRRLLPLYEYVAAEYVFPAVRRGASANPSSAVSSAFSVSSTPLNSFASFSADVQLERAQHIDAATHQWNRQYVEEQDALRLFGLPTAHRYPLDEDFWANHYNTCNSHQYNNNNNSDATHQQHGLHQGRFEPSLFNEWLSSLLSASLQWALHTDIDEDPLDPADADDFWKFDFARDRHHHSNKDAASAGGGYYQGGEDDPFSDPSLQPAWEKQWHVACGDAYVPFHYAIASVLNTATIPSTCEGTAATTLGADLLSCYSRPNPSALMKGSAKSATVLEHQVYGKALLGRSRVVIALRLLRAARIANIFSSNLPRDLQRIKHECFAVGPIHTAAAAQQSISGGGRQLEYGCDGGESPPPQHHSGAVIAADGTPEQEAARRRCETLLLNTLLRNLRASASDLLEALTGAFPSLIGSGLLEPAGRKMLEKVDEYLQRMLVTVGFRSDVDEDGPSSPSSSSAAQRAKAVAAEADDSGKPVSDDAIGLFVPAVGAEGNDLVNGEEDTSATASSPSAKLSAGTRILKGAMERLVILLRPMRMDLIQREVLVLEDLSTQIAGEIDLLRHLITCGVLDDEEDEDDADNDNSLSDSAPAVLPGEEAPYYLAFAADWCYSYWASQCKRIDDGFRALCDPLLAALDIPKMMEVDVAEGGLPTSTSAAAASTTANNSSSSAADGSLTTAARHLGSPLHPTATNGGMLMPRECVLSQLWAKDVLGALSWHLTSLLSCPPFPVMNANFDLRDWFDEQQRVCDEMTLLRNKKKSKNTNRGDNTLGDSMSGDAHRRFAARKFQLVTSPVALALLNRDANAVVELLSCALPQDQEATASSAYKRDWVHLASASRNGRGDSASLTAVGDGGEQSSGAFGSSTQSTSSPHWHSSANAQYESQRKNAVMSFNHASVPQLLHYLPYLSVAFPSKLLPLIIDAFPAISARVLYPALTSRNRRMRSGAAASSGGSGGDHNDGRIPLGGSPMRYDSHQAAAAVMNYWLQKAEEEEEIVEAEEAKRRRGGGGAQSRERSQNTIGGGSGNSNAGGGASGGGSGAVIGDSMASTSGSPMVSSPNYNRTTNGPLVRSGRSVPTSRRAFVARDTSSLLKLITSTTPFETQTKQDLLDDLCQCVLVVGQQKGPQVMELLTASTINSHANLPSPTAYGSTLNNRQHSNYGGGNNSHSQQLGGGSYFNNISSTAPSAAPFNKHFQKLVRASVQAINADPTNAGLAVRTVMRMEEASLRFLVSFASSRSYWATGASTKWSPLTVLSAALERRKHLLGELGDERDALETLLSGLQQQHQSSAAMGGGGGGVNTGVGPSESFAFGHGNPNHLRNSTMSVGDFGFNNGGKPTTAPSFFGGLLRKSVTAAKLPLGNRSGGNGNNSSSAAATSGGGGIGGSSAPTSTSSSDGNRHLDPIYANIGALSAAKRAMTSTDPQVNQHYNQLLQTQRKIVRVEDSIMVFLSSASLCLADAYHAQFAAAIANNFGKGNAKAEPVVQEHQQPVEVLVSSTFYPEVLRLLDVYVFPRAVLDLDLVSCFIEDHAKRRAVGDLLPLFQTDSGFAAGGGVGDNTIVRSNNARAANVSLFSVAGSSTCKLTEQHWLSLLQLSHANGCLEAAMMITMTVFVQQPKKARYLMRRAFPLLDFPDQLDPEVRRVAAKFAPILGLSV